MRVYDFDWSDHAQHKEALKQVCRDCEARGETSGVSPDAKRGLYESDFNFAEIDNDSVRAWINWAKRCVFDAARDANTNYWPAGLNVMIEVHESWCHITRDGGIHDMHTHPNSSWSAIYYLDCGDMDHATKNGLNRFYNPINSMWVDAGTAWCTANNSIDVKADEGMLVIFPSWVQHSALLYRGQRERYILSFNCKILAVS